MNVDNGRAEADEALDLGILMLGSDQEVEMDSVLHGLCLGDRLEEDASARAGPSLVNRVIGMTKGGDGPPTALAIDLNGVLDRHLAGVDQAGDERVDIFVLVVEGFGPERGQGVRVEGIEDDLRADGAHPAILAHLGAFVAGRALLVGMVPSVEGNNRPGLPPLHSARRPL